MGIVHGELESGVRLTRLLRHPGSLSRPHFHLQTLAKHTRRLPQRPPQGRGALCNDYLFHPHYGWFVVSGGNQPVKKQNLENFYPHRKRMGHYKIFSFGADFALFMEPTQQAAGYSASQNKNISSL
jgi:hypothetical protein